jgi:hypothetical protein
MLVVATAVAHESPVDAQQSTSQPTVCRDSRGRFASCGGGGDWFDAVPSLRVPSISLNLGRVIPSVSVGSPVKWGFKVPFSYTPRVKFMKFQVYFDPDFDYFTSKPGWITLAAFKAVGNQATVKSQNRAGSQKYRVYSPEGGGYESYTSATSKKTLKGTPTTGVFTIVPNPIANNQSAIFSVQISDTTAPRIVYILTRPTCDGSAPWISKVGLGPGWNVLAKSSVIINNSSAVVELQKSLYPSWVIVRQESGYYTYPENFDPSPTLGTTDAGMWSYSKILGLADDARCFAAVAPATGNKQMWISNQVQVSVKAQS